MTFGRCCFVWFSFFFLMLYEILRVLFVPPGSTMYYSMESKSLLICLGCMNLYLFLVDIPALGISE
jgi:hypothetical protein